MTGYSKMDWEWLKVELIDTFHHSDSRVYIYTRWYLEGLCDHQLERGNIGMQAFFLAYFIISHIMINRGALPE